MGVGEKGDRATWTQDALASSAGALSSITVAQPLDVIKVGNDLCRIHNIVSVVTCSYITFYSFLIFLDKNSKSTFRFARVRSINNDKVGKK